MRLQSKARAVPEHGPERRGRNPEWSPEHGPEHPEPEKVNAALRSRVYVASGSLMTAIGAKKGPISRKRKGPAEGEALG
jgi:hypothetical protein